jgi:hypothetical protein
VTGSSAYGGGLFVGGDLWAAGSQIDKNTASSPGKPGGASEGGGAYVVGAIALVTTTIDENQAVGGQARGAHPALMSNLKKCRGQ